MKRIILIIIALAVLSAAALIIIKTASSPIAEESTVISDTADGTSEITANEASSEDSTENETEMLLTETPNIQTGVTVQDTLKIISVGEADGVLTVLCENISEKSIKRAMMTVISNGEKLTFSVNDLLKGKKALLFSEEKRGFDKNAFYTNFTLENILTFDNEPSLREDEFEITLTEDSVAVKNISGKDIDSAVYIYYKLKTDNIPNGNETRRIRIEALPTGAVTYINAKGLSPETHEIIFADYE